MSQKFPESLSQLLASTKTGTRSFAAFKALPVDPARNMRRTNMSSGRYSETSEEVADALNCREVVDRIVDAISRVCERGFIVNEDVVRYVQHSLIGQKLSGAQFRGSGAEHDSVCQDGIWCEKDALAW